MQHPKNLLIERTKALGLGKPSFTTRNTGPEHEPIFESTVTIGRKTYGRGEGSTKRDAERTASEDALALLNNPDQGAGQSMESLEEVEEAFSGPWPIFPKVLATSLSVANARVNPTLMGAEAIGEVQTLALQLYRGVLENLGEVTELEDDEDEEED